MNTNDYSDLYIDVEHYFDECIDFICSRCSGNPLWHHKGLIHSFLTPSIKRDKTFYQNYFNDYEHGLFHGIMTGFIVSLLHKDKLIKKNNVILEQEYSSAFLHDILKSNNYPQEDHDKMLKDFYSNLKVETYVHSNPPDNFSKEYLIMADRIELARFEDYTEWVDSKYTNIFNIVEDITKIKIEKFYLMVRKALLYFYKNNDSIFIRHGLEQLNKGDFHKSASFPPVNSFLKIAEGYPIEIDRPPFGVLNNWNTNKCLGACSNHGHNSTFNQVKGFITYDEFMEKGGKIIDGKERDHLYAYNELKLSNWSFMFQQVNSNDKQVVELCKLGINIVPQSLVIKMFTFIKLLKDRLIVLNGCV